MDDRRDPPLSKLEIRILAHLADIANESGVATITQAGVAAACKAHRASVVRSMRSLKAHGLIKTEIVRAHFVTLQ